MPLRMLVVLIAAAIAVLPARGLAQLSTVAVTISPAGCAGAVPEKRIYVQVRKVPPQRSESIAPPIVMTTSLRATLWLSPGYWEIAMSSNGCVYSVGRAAIAAGHARHLQLEMPGYRRPDLLILERHAPFGGLMGQLSAGESDPKLVDPANGKTRYVPDVERDGMYYFDEPLPGRYALEIRTPHGLVRTRAIVASRKLTQL